MNTRTALSLALALALSSAAASAEPVRQVAGEPVKTTKAEVAPAFMVAQFPTAERSLVKLAGVPAEEIATLERRNAREGNIAPQIGINIANDVAPTPSLKWMPVPGGHVARLEVSSADALGLRVALKVDSLPAGVQLRFAGEMAADRVLMTTAEEAKSLVSDGVYWSPMTDGNTQIIEIFAPQGVATSQVKLSLPQVSHLLTNSLERFSLAKAIGSSGACNVNVVCRSGALGQGYVNATDAVARMVYTKPAGTYTCTGTLLNDTDAATQIPYFFSANHCISNQSEASTLNTFWNFQSTSCGSNIQATTTQRTGGATYLYSSASTDLLLMRLNTAPPGTAFYAGWDANVLANGSSVLAIHHPQADLKKSSLGQKTSQDNEVHYTGWTDGTTEVGSSGSGLFTQSGGQYYLRGGLWGGTAGCANSGNVNNPGNQDYYSRLDVEFDNVSQWLAPTPQQAFGPSAGRDYTGAWYVPSESGWGLTVYQYAAPTYNQFVMFFIYDNTGKAQWFELDATWTATDVRSGTVYASNAAPWSTTFNPGSRSFTAAGTATITYTSATTATVQFTINGVTRSASIQKL